MCVVLFLKDGCYPFLARDVKTDCCAQRRGESMSLMRVRRRQGILYNTTLVGDEGSRGTLPDTPNPQIEARV